MSETSKVTNSICSVRWLTGYRPEKRARQGERRDSLRGRAVGIRETSQVSGVTAGERRRREVQTLFSNAATGRDTHCYWSVLGSFCDAVSNSELNRVVG